MRFNYLFLWLLITLPLNADEVPGGRFSIATYNIAGLPETVKKMPAGPERFSLMGPLLNSYDIVLVQEDFWYHSKLIEHIKHPYRSKPKKNSWSEWAKLKLINDGLNRFSKIPFSDFTRTPWKNCHDYFSGGYRGNDCLAAKGFSRATHTLTAESGVEAHVDIYNLHMESDRSPAGIAITHEQITSLFNDIGKRPADHAIIVAGDFNFRFSTDAFNMYPRFKLEADLLDSFALLKGRVDREAIDRIYFKNSRRVKLSPVKVVQEIKRFRNKQGQKLSDHNPHVTVFEWSVETDY